MKTSSAALVAALAASSAAQEMRVQSSKTSKMQSLMDIKMSHREKHRVEGAFDAGRYPRVADKVECVDGYALEFQCDKVDLWGFLPHDAMGSTEPEGNDIWGWTSKCGREFALVGQLDGTAFVEITKSGELLYLGRLPQQTAPSVWRDLKTVGHYVYIGSEASGSGVQVFDLTKLLDLDPASPKTFSLDDLTAWIGEVSNSHNIVANEETNMIYVVGSQLCRGGLYMVDVSDPTSPTAVGCLDEDGYTHDSQCVVYTGVDEAFVGHEICFNFDEDTVMIADVTDKANPVILSNTGYAAAGYTHQGWLATEDMAYLLMDDELDEYYGTIPDTYTTTYLMDISNLTAPFFTGTYKSPAMSIDHNQYVVDGYAFQANYRSGLRIVDLESLPSDPTGAGLYQAGFFDVDPTDDDIEEGDPVEFGAAWGVYPFLPSGFILINSIERGLFVLRFNP